MEQKNELTLDSLPEDCLECIFSKIDKLKTQIQVSKVCASFLDLCTHIWHVSHRCLCLEEWKAFELTSEDLQYFVRATSPNVLKIKLITYFLHDFITELHEDLQVGCLPKVLRFETENIMDLCANDADIYMLTQLIPNVRILRLTPALTGRHLKLFEQLQELYLYHEDQKEYELKKQYLSEIFENLKHLRVLDVRSFELSKLDLISIDKCQNLEVLKLNLNALKPVLDMVLSLPSLKTLTVLLDQVIDVTLIENVDTYDFKINETFEFYYILEHKCENITGIAVDNQFLPLTPNWDEKLEILKLKKLTKFAFCNYVFIDDMLDKYADMRELRILSCRNWSKLTNEKLLRLVVSCTKLEHLDITYCKCITEDFLHGAFRVLRNRGKRKPELSIYYAMSAIGDEIEKHTAYSKWITLMNLSSDFPPNSDIGLSYVQRGYEFDFV